MSDAVKVSYYDITAASKAGLVATTFADDAIERGYAFQVHRRVTVPTAGKKVVFDFSAVTKQIRTLPLRMRTNEGQVFVDTYAISSYTGGAAIPAALRNTTIASVSETVIKDGITSSDVAGDDVREYIIGTRSAIFNPGGGGADDDNPKKLAPAIIVLDIDNQESSDVVLEINFNWFESPE